MSLKVGIVGFPNVGKSTLFNAVLKKQQALSANYPFATIEPNVGVVEVVDNRVDTLAKISNSQKKVYSTIEFVDIAGLVKGAHKGEGLGNQFLANIREVDLILLMLRDFSDENVIREGSRDVEYDKEIILTELMLKDLETANKAYAARKKDAKAKDEALVLERIINALEDFNLVSSVVFTKESEIKIKNSFQFLTDKPIIDVINVDEFHLGGGNHTTSEVEFASGGKQRLMVSAKLESELAVLSEEDQKAFLEDLGLTEPPLNRIVRFAYDRLGLISYLTTGDKESRSWAIVKGTKAPQAAGVIHTDFEKNFIKAKVVSFDDFVKNGGWVKSREAGVVGQEGKDYEVKDRDVIDFMAGG